MINVPRTLRRNREDKLRQQLEENLPASEDSSHLREGHSKVSCTHCGAGDQATSTTERRQGSGVGSGPPTRSPCTLGSEAHSPLTSFQLRCAFSSEADNKLQVL